MTDHGGCWWRQDRGGDGDGDRDFRMMMDGGFARVTNLTVT